MSATDLPLVYLVGAGAGDPGLLTMRAVECLADADVILHDKLVSPRILSYASPAAQLIRVDDLPGEHPQRWPHINQTMIDLARSGKKVVRLKGGDPNIFGRGAEEAEALRTAGIPYEIIPGITAANAAAAYAEIPLTHRSCASAVAFITGHENPTKAESSLDWDSLARFPGTLVIYMGMARLELIVQVLLDKGKPADTTAAVVQMASTGYQLTQKTTLDRLEQAVRDEGMMPPALIIIGPVVDLKPVKSWFESRPLFGKRVLVTRPEHQAAEMAHRLEELGAVPFVMPAIEVKDPLDWSAVDEAIARLAEFHWIVFTSANGVDKFFARILQEGKDLRVLGQVKLAAIGPQTAEALKRFHVRADLVPDSFRSEDLAAALIPQVSGKRVLLARADRGRELLRDELMKVCLVEQIAVYSQVDRVEIEPVIQMALCRGEIGYVTLTSSNIARAFLNSLDSTCRMRVLDGTIKLISISPVTSTAIRELGFEVSAEAEEYTSAGIIAALVKLTRANP